MADQGEHGMLCRNPKKKWQSPNGMGNLKWGQASPCPCLPRRHDGLSSQSVGRRARMLPALLSLPPQDARVRSSFRRSAGPTPDPFGAAVHRTAPFGSQGRTLMATFAPPELWQRTDGRVRRRPFFCRPRISLVGSQKGVRHHAPTAQALKSGHIHAADVSFGRWSAPLCNSQDQGSQMALHRCIPHACGGRLSGPGRRPMHERTWHWNDDMPNSGTE